MAQYPDARLIAGATELGLDITKHYRKFPDAHFRRSDSGTERDHAALLNEWTIGAASNLDAAR